MPGRVGNGWTAKTDEIKPDYDHQAGIHLSLWREELDRMAQKYCRTCGAQLVQGNPFCPKCLQRIPEDVIESWKVYPKDTPENRAKEMKEYKVVGMEDSWQNGGRFDKVSLENMINHYSLQGWRVREISASKTLGLFSSLARDELLVILERDMPLEPV